MVLKEKREKRRKKKEKIDIVLIQNLMFPKLRTPGDI